MIDFQKKLAQALVLMEVALALIDEAGTGATVACNLDLAVHRLREVIEASAQNGAVAN